jgi:hypothetical protein
MYIARIILFIIILSVNVYHYYYCIRKGPCKIQSLKVSFSATWVQLNYFLLAGLCMFN